MHVQIETEKKLNEIQQHAVDAKLKIENSGALLKHHCANLAKRVNVDIDGRILELQELRHKLLQEINEYEAKCERTSQESKSELVANIDSVQEWAKSMVSDANQVNGISLNELDRRVDSESKKLQLLLLELEEFPFGGQLLTYDEKQSPCCLQTKQLPNRKVLEHFLNKKSYASSNFKIEFDPKFFC
jgi:seryl-tRNA synthetase